MARPHETVLIRRVIGAVREYQNDPKGRLDRMVRRSHDDVVTDAVYVTLAAIGITVRADGSLADTAAEVPFPRFDHSRRTTKYRANVPSLAETLGFCCCEFCKNLPDHEPPMGGEGG